MKTYSEHLAEELSLVKNLVIKLLDNSKIKIFRNDPYSNVVFISPSNYWDTPTETEQSLQIEIKELFGKWLERFKLITESFPEDLKDKLSQTEEFIYNWVEKNSTWDIPNTISEAKQKFEDDITIYYDTLRLLSKSNNKEIIIIPDTNALIKSPDPTTYKTIVGNDKITIAFLPTVLSELDELKIKSSNQDFQKKVKSVIKRLKGYRNQGNLIKGITVDKSITLKMIASEPNFNKTLSWLVSRNNDDRIIASALEIQRHNPSSVVCIVTSDINLQNKTEMASLCYFDMN